MNPFSLLSHIFCYIYLHMFLAIALNSWWFSPNRTVSALGNHTDHSALLKFKESISKDPYGVLNSWNSSTQLCNWHGVTCSPIHQRVTLLNLQGYGLYGTISPQVGNLSFLRGMDLSNNSFYGKIPQELGRLMQLKYLYLNNNSLAGEIPTNLTSCSNLKGIDFSWNNLMGRIPTSIGNLSSLTLLYLDDNNLEGDIPTSLTNCSEFEILFLAMNNLIGKIPFQIGSLKKLQQLSIQRNKLTGQIPATIGNISSLSYLVLGDNNLEGNIPQEIGCLGNLTFLQVGGNKLSGMLPYTLYNMSSLITVSATDNQFNGSLPSDMFNTLPNLQYFGIGGNQISGTIPNSITNASALQEITIVENYFVGQVPRLGKLQDIERINLSKNNLGSNSTKDLNFLEPLTNCSKLRVLSIAYNKFGGCLPNVMGNLSTQLSRLYVGGNEIFGKIPVELGNLNSLILLTMESNYFYGNIPAAFGKLQKIQLLDLSGNKLSGNIPDSIGNLSQLYLLSLGENMLEGNIPLSIGNCQKLQTLNLSQNNLKGPISSEVLIGFSLVLDLSQNLLTGNLPDEVGKLKNINHLDVSNNCLSGDIPGTIEECVSMKYLYLQGNFIQGIIPSSLASLKDLRRLDLSRNRLFGTIPEGFQNISVLEYLNVSFNMLDGEVPTEGVFQNARAFIMTGNGKLCGGVSELHLPPCPVKGRRTLAKHHNFRRLITVIVCVVAFLLILSFSLIICRMRKRNKKPSSESPTLDHLVKVSYQNLHNGTDGFSSRNLIGSGNFGSVYKGTLQSKDKVVAIKVLNLQKKGAHKSFIAECKALKNIRHRNLVKILTCCSSNDYRGQEFKALVFEFMTNGSLDSWLHPAIEVADQSKSLDLEQRLNIITDVASALHYLHYECEQAVIHCDIKPANILLDDCFVAHVSDFGLARLLSSFGIVPEQTSTTGVKGTIGYTPPEYGIGSEMSIEGDVYSFGVLVLEILTGRRPTDEIFEDGQNLQNYVKTSIPNHLLQIVDPTILSGELERAGDSENLTLMHPDVQKCLLSLLRIALACSMESPKERMSMVDFIRELNLIKSFYPSVDINGG